MPLKGIIQERIKNFTGAYPDLFEKSESDKFQVFSLFNILKDESLDFEQILLGIVDGGDDYGIDALYSFIDGHIINSLDEIEDFFNAQSQVKFRILQIKRETGFKEETLLKLKDGLENIFNLEQELKGNKGVLIN